MTPIPEEIQKKADEYSITSWKSLGGNPIFDKVKRKDFLSGATFGYNLRENEIAELRKEVQSAKKYLLAVSEELGKTDADLQKARSERDRILGLVKIAFSTFRMRSFPHNEPTWEQFQTENNL